VLELRPAQQQPFWSGWLRGSGARSALSSRAAGAKSGSALGFVRDGARIVRSSLRKALELRSLRFLHSVFSLQHRIETSFVSSGAAAQLADAALEGENTRDLAGRIARIARRLCGAAGVTVHLKTGGGVQMLGCDGEPCTPELASRGLESGRVEWGEGSAAVPLLVHGQVVGALSVAFDGGLRDLRALQPLLIRAAAVLAAAERESRKDRFLSLAAHELKTPLTSIKGFSYSLARRLEKGEPCDPRHVQVLERQAERLHALLEEMLEVSRIETGRFVLHQEPCEVAEVVEAARRSLRRLGADADVDAHVEPSLPLLADRERIERALTAMVLRARALGPVSIDARRKAGVARISVQWSGDPLRDPQHALEPLWEAPPPQRQGLGMALVVARRAAEAHGGTLRVEPHAFVLELPLRSRAPRRPGGAEGRVLVVDDDEPIARMMAEFLAEHGFEADWAGGGRLAFAKIKADPPDVIVLDLRMPDIDGRALLAAVRAEGVFPRVVLFSADREVANAALELSCEAFVEKPFAPESLLDAVRRAAADEGRRGNSTE
jgi:signal transduction histidine kinase/ActR/RegA family two-component response regulator